MNRIPRFKTDKEAAKFWDTHSFAGYAEDAASTKIRFVKKTKKSITVRLDPEDIARVGEIAEKKGLNYTALIRMWIKEHLAA
jgi:predicted DNA binding CopG/RHH family protein